MLAQRVDVLHDVELADARPVGRADRAGRTAHRPERGPIAQSAGRVGLEDGRAHLELSAGRGGEVGALGLDASGGPVAGPVAESLDDQVALAVLVDVVGGVGGRLDLARSPVGGTSGVTGTQVVQPVGPVQRAAGRAVEVVGEEGGPAGRSARYGRRGAAAAADQACERADEQYQCAAQNEGDGSLSAGRNTGGWWGGCHRCGAPCQACGMGVLQGPASWWGRGAGRLRRLATWSADIVESALRVIMSLRFFVALLCVDAAALGILVRAAGYGRSAMS